MVRIIRYRQVFLAGGVPEVMLHLRRAGLLELPGRTVTGETLDENLNCGNRANVVMHSGET